MEFSPAPEGTAGGGSPSDGGGATPPDTGATPGGPDTGQNATRTDGRGSAPPGATATGSGGGPTLPPLLETVRDGTDRVSNFAGEAIVGGLAVLTQPERLWHIFVRSGTIPSVNYGTNDYEAIDLAVLEAMPLLGTLVALPVLAGRRVRSRGVPLLDELDPRNWRPARQTDLLVVTLAVVLTIVYLPRLPLFSLLTVRYLHPVLALGAYGVWRVPAVRAGLSDTRWAVGSYLASFAVALTVLVGGIGGLGLAVGEAVQYNALWNLAAATVCAVAVTGWTVSEEVSDRLVTVGLSLPAGFASAYLLLSALVYFRYGSYAFDVLRVLADVLPAL